MQHPLCFQACNIKIVLNCKPHRRTAVCSPAIVTSYSSFSKVGIFYYQVLNTSFNCCHAGFRDALKAVKKVIGMRLKRQPVARTGWFRTAAAEKLDDVPVDLELLERCEAYEELLDSLESEDPEDQINELEQSIAEARKLALERFKSSGIGVKKAASENTVGKVLYGADLLFTVSTKWCNNPAPPNGVCTLDVQKNDRWGQSHILEVRGEQRQKIGVLA